MSILDHFNSVAAKPGLSFNAKSQHGFAGKLHTAIQNNYHGLGTLKNNATAVEALKTQVIKNQHYIRTGGLSKHQAEKMIHKVHHEAALKGDHLSATEKEALHKLSAHLTKMEVHREHQADPTRPHAISSISASTHTTSVSQIGDQTKMVQSGQAPNASGGIASLIKRKNNLGTPPSPSKPMPPRIKLSI